MRLRVRVRAIVKEDLGGFETACMAWELHHCYYFHGFGLSNDGLAKVLSIYDYNHDVP